MRLASAEPTSAHPELSGLQGRSLLDSGVRQRAEAVLQSLVAAKAECEKQLTKLRRTDAMKAVTGKSSIDRAINSTRQIIREIEESSDAGTRPAAEVEARCAVKWNPRASGVAHAR